MEAEAEAPRPMGRPTTDDGVAELGAGCGSSDRRSGEEIGEVAAVDVDVVDVDEVAGAGSAEADEVAGAEIDGSGIRHREAETVTDERKRRTRRSRPSGAAARGP